MPTVAADTNVLVRFLLQQPPDQYARAGALMEKVSGGQVEIRISAAVVGEVATILHHVHGQPQAEVAEALLALVSARGVQLDEQAIVVVALEHARDLTDIDFVDAYVAAKAAGDGLAVASFDKGAAQEARHHDLSAVKVIDGRPGPRARGGDHSCHLRRPGVASIRF
jgi:predicted nucleic-acid-binding protein